MEDRLFECSFEEMFNLLGRMEVLKMFYCVPMLLEKS